MNAIHAIHASPPTGPPDCATPGEAEFVDLRDAVARSFDALLDGLRDGRLTGIPLQGEMPLALLEILRRLDWHPDPSVLSAALPHHPEVFDLAALRETLHRLGFATQRSRLARREILAASDTGVTLIEGPGDELRIATGKPDPSVRDLWGRPAGRLRRTRRYDCLLVERQPPRRPSRRPVLREIVARFAPELRLALGLTLISGLNLIAASLSIGVIFAIVLPARALDTLAMLLLGIGGLVAFDVALRRIRAQVLARVAARLEYLVATEMHAKLLTLPIAMVKGVAVSDQIGRLKQFETMRDLLGGPVVSVLLELPLVLVMVLTIAVINLPSALVVLCGIALHVALGALAIPRLTSAQTDLSERSSEQARLLSDALSQREQILRRGLGSAFARRLRDDHRQVAVLRLRAEAARRRLGAILQVLTPLTGAGVLVMGASQAITGSMPSAALIVCMILTMRLLSPVHQAVLMFARAPEIRNLLRQIDTLLRLEDVRPEAPSAGAVIDPRPGEAARLALDGVTIRYPDTAVPALAGINLVIGRGRLITVTGPSGAGKTTLLRAVASAYPLTAGRICLGPVNLAHICPHQRCRLIGHLSETPLLIHGSIAQNLALGTPNLGEDAMHEVSEELGLLGAIAALPQGLNARLDDETLARLTPAFRVKLAIGRLLLGDPAILLLDEPESRLSPSDEERLMNAIRRRTEKGTICLMVTHRPSLMRASDKVLRLENGRAVSLDPFEAGASGAGS